jgi:hypothetical protein
MSEQLTRRRMMKRTLTSLAAMLASSGLRVNAVRKGGLIVQQLFADPTEALTSKLFLMAEKAWAMKKGIMAPKFVQGDDEFQDHVGLVIEPGKSLRSHFLFDCAGHMALSSTHIIDDLPNLLGFACTRDWKKQRPFFCHVLEQFFGDRDFRSSPAWAWVLPAHVPAGRKLFAKASIKSTNTSEHSEPDINSSDKFYLRFGHRRIDAAIEIDRIDRQHLQLDYPEGRHCPSRLDSFRQLRGGSLPDGTLLRPVFEDSIGLVGTEDNLDFPEGYSPVYEPFITRDEQGFTRFIRARTLICCRLEPEGSTAHGWTHQLFITFNPNYGRTMYINAIARDFGQFVKHNLHLRGLLTKAADITEETEGGYDRAH